MKLKGFTQAYSSGQVFDHHVYRQLIQEVRTPRETPRPDIDPKLRHAWEDPAPDWYWRLVYRIVKRGRHVLSDFQLMQLCRWAIGFCRSERTEAAASDFLLEHVLGAAGAVRCRPHSPRVFDLISFSAAFDVEQPFGPHPSTQDQLRRALARIRLETPRAPFPVLAGEPGPNRNYRPALKKWLAARRRTFKLRAKDGELDRLFGVPNGEAIRAAFAAGFRAGLKARPV